MKLRVPELLILFLLGAAASLVCDHSHVVTGTTEYFTDAVPFVWSSPIWFPIMVGAATVSLAELRLHLPDPRTTVTPRQVLAGIAAVIGTYVTTALVHSAPPVPSTTLIVAIIGPVVEIVLVRSACSPTMPTPTDCSASDHGLSHCISRSVSSNWQGLRAILEMLSAG